jgi:hypothetical protein
MTIRFDANTRDAVRCVCDVAPSDALLSLYILVMSTAAR